MASTHSTTSSSGIARSAGWPLTSSVNKLAHSAPLTISPRHFARLPLAAEPSRDRRRPAQCRVVLIDARAGLELLVDVEVIAGPFARLQKLDAAVVEQHVLALAAVVGTVVPRGVLAGNVRHQRHQET